MNVGDITAIHTNITRAEHEQWRKSALNILDVLQKTSHYRSDSVIPLYYIEIENYLYISLRLFFNSRCMATIDKFTQWVELEYSGDNLDIITIRMDDARAFVLTCDDFLPLVFADDNLPPSQDNGHNPSVGRAIEKIYSPEVYHHEAFRKVFGRYGSTIKESVATIIATTSFLKHRLIVMYLIEQVEYNKFTPEILPEYLQLSFRREFDFPWTGQPVNSQLLIDFLLHCHYKPFLIQFTNKEVEEVAS